MAATQMASNSANCCGWTIFSTYPHTVLVCQNLEKYYGTHGSITKALDGINLGEFIYHGSLLVL